jgi:DNA-binding winged helix-turn-helix (wHTH) protein
VPAVKRFGPYLLDPVNQTLNGPAGRIELSPKTFGVLQHLVGNRGRLLRHEELLAAVWPNTFVQPEILKTHIRMLRKALGDDAGAPRFIETRARLGYRFIAEVTSDAEAGAGGPAAGVAAATTPGLPGRAAQLARLHAALAATDAGDRRVAFVTGEAGAGKTALLDTFAEEAGATRDLWLGCGRGRARSGAEPLQPLLEILGGWCRSGAGAAVRQMLALHAPSCRGLIATALGPAGPERRRSSAEAPAGTARAVREIADLLEAMAELRPVLLLLDDLHGMDEATLALVSTLARRPGRRRLMIVAAARPDAGADAPQPLRRLMLDLLVHRLAEELPLPPLAAPDIAAWLAAEAGGHAAPEDLAAFLLTHSDGNPMLAGALLDHLVEAAMVQRDPRLGWRLAARPTGADAREARRVQQMLDLEIEELDPAERQVLEAASIAGRSFCTWSVYTMLDLAPAMAEDLCRNLCRRDLLREVGQRNILPDGTASPRFAFVHGLFRDILHQRQAAARRAVWHRCLGERAEANWGPRAHVIAAELAYRFREGGDWERAILYSRHAAREALDSSGVDAALALLELAMEHCRHLPEADRSCTEAALRQEIARLARQGREAGGRAVPRGPDGAPAH